MGKQTKHSKTVKKTKKNDNQLFESKPRNFRVGGAIQPKRNLTRFVRWPKYITLQRQKRILLTRIKVPPIIAQFSKPLERQQAHVLFRLLKKYSPEDQLQKKARLVSEARLKQTQTVLDKPKPQLLKFGLNHVTRLIEERKAKLVIIANDVDPIQLVVWLPTLCRKMDIPYCFVRGKAALGRLVHQKNAAVVALTSIRKEDESQLSNLVSAARSLFNSNKELSKIVGGNKLGFKSQIKFDKVQAERERETLKKLKN